LQVVGPHLLDLHPPKDWRSVTTSGELAPVEAEVDDKQRGKREGDDADGGGKNVAEMAPVRGPEVEHAAGDEGKGDGVGAAIHWRCWMIWRLRAVMKAAVVQTIQAAACMEVPGRPGRPAGESDPREGTDKDGDDVDAAEDAMEFEVTLADREEKLMGPIKRAKIPASVCGMRRWRSAMTCRR
jgi:hypothetical protein